MKLATLKNDTRDGALVVVSKDLKSMVSVEGIVPTLQEALENWAGVHNELDQVSSLLNAGQARDAAPFDCIVRRVSCVHADTLWYYFYDAARDAVVRPDDAPPAAGNRGLDAGGGSP